MRAIYQDILRRAYDSLWHPSVRWPKLYARDYQGYDNWRYPAPASENIQHIEHDFKTPYRESMYHVREAEIERNHEFYYFFADPVTETPNEKLVRLRFLDKNDINNDKAVELAKQKYAKENQEPLEQKIQVDETEQSNLQLFINQNKSREALASLVKKQFEEIREASEENLIEGNLKDDYKPQFLDRVDLNLFANDPVARQFQLDIRVTLQKLGEQHYKEGYQSFFVGDPNYWHALDNSFTSQQIKLVQSAAQDDVSLLDPKTLQAVQNSNDYHKEKRVKLPFKNEYYK